MTKRPNSRASSSEQVFIMHAHCDGDLAQSFCNWICKAFSTTCFLTPSSVPAGADYFPKILNAVEKCQLGIVLLTSRSFKSMWVQFEVGAMFAKHKTVIPICFDVTEQQIPASLNRNQACFWESLPDRYSFVRAVQRYLNLPGPPADLIENINVSYDANKIRFEWEKSSEAFLDRLGSGLPRREEAQFSTRLRDSDNPVDFLTLELLDHYWKPYQTAVVQASSSLRTLPLENDPRIKVAIKAVNKAKDSVRMISINSNDGWTNNRLYISAKQSAAERKLLGKVCRIIIISEESDLQNPDLRNVLMAERRSGILIRWVKKDDIRINKERGQLPSDLHLRNVLIVDNCIMTRSHPDRTDGELVVSLQAIQNELGHFDALWSVATEFE